MTDELEELFANIDVIKRALQQSETRSYSPHAPFPAQQRFLDLDCFEALYGGAAGGGKSDALLMAALQYVHIPYYNALILRKSYSDLSLPGAIMDRSHAWLRGTDATWAGLDRQWRFPSGAKIQFGYLDNENDKFRYQSANFHYIAFDELTQFPESRYSYLLSRCRRNANETVPLRIRSASNPGGVGHDWVWRRFVSSDAAHGRIFVPAGLGDNPHLDQASYRKALESLDSVTRRQLLDGEWIQDTSGLVYRFASSDRLEVSTLPAGKYTYIIGVDFGINDKTAFSVIGWREYDKTIYVAECFGDSNIIPSDAARITLDLMKKYSPERVIGDTGGMGKAYCEEMRRRYGIPILPAEKQNKIGYISLLNGMLEEGKIKLVNHLTLQLAEEWSKLIWHESRLKEHPGFDNHCADATLYAVRAANAFIEESEPSPLPKWGTEEAFAQKARELEERAERDWERQQRETEVEW